MNDLSFAPSYAASEVTGVTGWKTAGDECETPADARQESNLIALRWVEGTFVGPTNVPPKPWTQIDLVVSQRFG